MKFKYSARTKAGEKQAGFVEAANKEAAINILRGNELFILSMEEAERRRWFGSLFNFFYRVKRSDLMIFTRQFATMLEAKVPLSEALRNLHNQTRNAALREVILTITNDVESGIALSQSLERHPEVFSDFYINLVRSAEITGRVEEVMGFLADFLEREYLLVSKVRNAMIYPSLVLGLFVVVAGILVGVVFPQLGPLFEDANTELPLITQILLSTGTFMAKWWLAIIIIVAVIIAALVDYFRTQEGRLVFDEVSIRLPIIGDLFRKMHVARFAEASSILIKGGVPVAQAMEISGHTVGNLVYREALREASNGVREGELLSQVLAKHADYFPPLVSQMVAVGETTGQLDEMFRRIAGFFSREVNSVVDNLVELIQPVLMIFIGTLVGLLFASILLPIYNLAQAF